jgi:hypothetical protein
MADVEDRRHFRNGISSEVVCFQQVTKRPSLQGWGCKGHDILVVSVYSVSRLMAVYADLEASCMAYVLIGTVH